MFDLDLIEQDWKKNSFCLSEEEIIEIYESEHVSLSEYEKYHNQITISAEERLLQMIFNEVDRESKQREEELNQKYGSIKKNRLSKEKQKIVVEGSLWIVFDSTREWYNFFDGKISMEKIYYVCLEALMNSVKYVVHCGKPIFRFYVLKSIKTNIIKYVSKYMHITYREAYEMIQYISDIKVGIEPEMYFNYDIKNAANRNQKFLKNSLEEKVEKPSKIYYRLKNGYYDVNYIKRLSSNEFMVDYESALEKLDGIAKEIMQLSFDNSGYRGLTNIEIADYLGIDPKTVSNIRRKAIKTLRKDPKLNTYL